MAVHVLAPIHPVALAPTAAGEVPDPVCGPYCASTPGVRYSLTDLRWPNRAIFVEEGQERPLFYPSGITVLPKAFRLGQRVNSRMSNRDSTSGAGNSSRMRPSFSRVRTAIWLRVGSSPNRIGASRA